MKGTAAGRVFDLVGASWKPEVNRGVLDKHDQRTEKDGKIYNPTGAMYNNHFNPSLIIAKNNFGPAAQGKKRPIPVTGGPNDPFPPLARLSDVLFLEYQRVMTENNLPMDGLKGIWRDNVVNELTKSVAIKLASDSYMLHGIPKWPGVDFAIGSDEFAALIASPNGVGVAFFLLQHREQLGRKTFSSVKVFYDMALHIVFLIDDTGAQPGPASKERRSLVNSSAFGLEQHRTSVAHYLQPRALDDSTFATFAEKGKALVSALQATDTCAIQSEWTSDDALATWGWYRRRKPNEGPVPLFTSTKLVYEFVGASTENNMNHRAIDIHDTKKEIDGVTYYNTGAEFDNRYNPSMIVAEGIYGAEYQGNTKDPPVTGDPNPLPKLKFWSDVTFLEFQKFMRDSGQPIDALKAVWHRAIINVNTRDLAARLCAVDDWTSVPDWPGKDFKLGSEGFAALIGSDNGKGVVHLLLQHREQLGSKTVTNARVWKDHTLHVLYSIEDTCGGGSGSAPKTRSLVRRADEPDSQKVEDARAAGRFLVMAQDSTTDVLSGCLNIPQSSFTDPHQLSDSGWMMIQERTQALDEESDEATFNSWLDTNLDLAESSNQIIEYHHLEKTTGSDGTVYYPSGAYYQNLYSVGGIAAMDNASPWKTGRNANPTVDGRARPFPPLKQWSDAVFLIYKDFCGGDPVKMKKLKVCLRHNVVNTRAREVLHEYMEKHGDLEDGRPKTWPGTEYKLGDDGFFVALGVPNGKGVAYLLATHRDALGRKEIYKIRIFSVDWASSYNILYYIRDHSDNPTRRQLLHAPPNLGTNATSTRDLAVRVAGDDSLTNRNKAVQNLSHWPRAGDPGSAIYTKSLKSGALLYCLLHGSASSTEPSRWVDFDSLAEYGWATDVEAYDNTNQEMVGILNTLGVPTSVTSNQRYWCVHRDDSIHDGVEYPASNAQYVNVLNPDGGAVIAEMNYGPMYMDDTIEPIPLRQYSDVVFLAWQQAAGDRIKGLKYVFRHHIANKDTLDVTLEILQKRGERAKLWPGYEISMTERDAWAIMGTPNGRGAAWMLIQHKQQPGLKSIRAVTIYSCDKGHYCLCFWIEDLDHEGVDMQVPPDLQTPPVGNAPADDQTAKRSLVAVDQHKKKSAVTHSGVIASRHWARADEDPSATYGASLRSGIMLQCKLDNDAESEPPSRWPNYDSLGSYGWDTAGGQEYQVGGELADVYQDLGLSTARTANLRHKYSHHRETEHEGHTYPPTTAHYTNIFNVDGGAILADMNTGPDYAAHDGFSGEIVPLKQYSDVVFLAWQHEADGRTNGLRYILRHGIINGDTNDVAEHILERRGLMFQSWPGLKIPFPHRDALALMGTPNGRGAAWMLIQHKRELGMKRFSDVTIFVTKEGLSLCFWIEDVHDGDMDLDLPQDLQGSSQSDDVQAAGGPSKRAAVVPVNDTTTPSTVGYGERFVRAISKRAGDVVKNFWTGLRLY